MPLALWRTSPPPGTRPVGPPPAAPGARPAWCRPPRGRLRAASDAPPSVAHSPRGEGSAKGRKKRPWSEVWTRRVQGVTNGGSACSPSPGAPLTTTHPNPAEPMADRPLILEPTKTSCVRRAIGICICCSPVLLAGCSMVKAITHSAPARPLTLGLLVLAALVGGLNFYLSFLRGTIYRRAHDSMEGYRHVSGVPLVGTLLVVIGLVVGFGSLHCAVLGLVGLVLDTGGLPWFLIATWRDESLWDR